jgi:hypothetical protein
LIEVPILKCGFLEAAYVVQMFSRVESCKQDSPFLAST